MNKVKSQKSKVKTTNKKLKSLVLTCSFAFCVLAFALNCFSQEADDLELTVDLNSSTIPLPKVFSPNIDLSGRGLNLENTWPQNLASRECLDAWQKDIGFNGFYRIQFNLWEITQLSQEGGAREKLLANYESVIKRVNDAGGTVILDIFGTPAGMGKILDKKSSPLNLAEFKDLIKGIIQDLSCDKKYDIWYEVWSAPDLENFFLGREADYLNLYRVISESARELEGKYKTRIRVGAPSASSWFNNLGANTILTPEGSLIYALIKFCYQNHLSLDFITWHGFSSDPKAEKENTIYDKNAVNLARDWLSYFNFDKNIPFIVSEWNYDRDINFIPERKEKSYITASYIPARLKNMHEAGVDNQVYFCLEDFQNIKERVTRNVGVFYFTPKRASLPKASYNAFRMLKALGKEMFPVKLNDEFVGALATKSEGVTAILIYNYIDPEIVQDYLAQNIAGLNPAESKFLLGALRSGQLLKIVSQHEEVGTLPTTNRVKSLLKSSEELFNKAKHFESSRRSLKINLKGLKGDYLYSLFTIDESCGLNCEFKPSEEKEINALDSYQEELSLSPYSVNLIILKQKPKEAKPESPQPEEARVKNLSPEPVKPEPVKQPAESAETQEPLKDAAGK